MRTFTLILILISSGAFAQTPPVPKLIKAGASIGVVPPTLAVEFQGKYYCNAGGDLWMSDGTDAGTVKLKDIASSPVYMYAMRAVGNKLFMVAHATDGAELWVSDGTAAGTQLVKEINPAIGQRGVINNYSDHCLVPLNNEVFFYGHDGVNGVELWKSDGTASGTVMVKDINPAPGASCLDTTLNNMPEQCIIAVNGKIFFSADDGANGPELWVSDGTAAGTSLVADLLPGNQPLGNSGPDYMTVFNNKVVFNTGTTATTAGLFISDGTANGTVKLSDNIYIGESSEYAILNNKLYFMGREALPVYKPGLCVTDGTAAGTSFILELTSGPILSTKAILSSFLTSYNSKLYFSSEGSTVTAQGELYESDGTGAGTLLFRDFTPYLKNNTQVKSQPSQTTLFGGKMYLWVTDTARNDIWVTDGTANGTKMIQYPNTDYKTTVFIQLLNTKRSPLTIVGNSLFFWNGYTTADGISLYKLNMFADAITDVNKHTEAILYPNPATDVLHIQAANAERIDFYSITGSTVYSNFVTGDVQAIDISQLTPAMYTATVSFSDGSRQNLKFVKQ